MASYTVLPNSELNAELPLTQSKMQRLNENPKAVNENNTTNGVPYLQLQLAEGIRTNLADDDVIIASGWKMIGASNPPSNSADYRDPFTGLVFTVDPNKKYMAWGHASQANIPVFTNGVSSICHVVNGAISFTSSLPWGAVNSAAFSISGLDLTYGGFIDQGRYFTIIEL